MAYRTTSYTCVYTYRTPQSLLNVWCISHCWMRPFNPAGVGWTHTTPNRRLTFCVHGYSDGGLEAFVMHQTLDRDVFEQSGADRQRADDQRGTVALRDQRGHWGAHCAVVPLHVPHDLCCRP